MHPSIASQHPTPGPVTMWGSVVLAWAQWGAPVLGWMGSGGAVLHSQASPAGFDVIGRDTHRSFAASPPPVERQDTRAHSVVRRSARPRVSSSARPVSASSLAPVTPRASPTVTDRVPVTPSAPFNVTERADRCEPAARIYSGARAMRTRHGAGFDTTAIFDMGHALAEAGMHAVRSTVGMPTTAESEPDAYDEARPTAPSGAIRDRCTPKDALRVLHDISTARDGRRDQYREGFARGIASALRYYGARTDEPLTQGSVTRLIDEAVDRVAFGEPALTIFAIGNGTLIEGARSRLSVGKVLSNLRDAYANALDIAPELAAWLCRQRLAEWHAVIARADIDTEIEFGGFAWADLQMGAEFARATGRDPTKLTVANLTALAHASVVSVRNGTISASNWMSVVTHAAVFHALNRGERALDELAGEPTTDQRSQAYGALSASIDARWAHVKHSMEILDSVTQLYEARPDGRRALALRMLQARYTSSLRFHDSWIDPRVELYMSYPDGRTSEIALPNLDDAYRGEWDHWERQLAGNLTRLMGARVLTSDEPDVFTRIHDYRNQGVRFIVPRLNCTIRSDEAAAHTAFEWMRELWRDAYAPVNGTLVVAIDGESGLEHWAVAADTLIEDLKSMGARPVPRLRSPDLNTLVKSARTTLFSEGATRGIEYAMRTGKCDLQARPWIASRASASAGAQFAEWLAHELARSGHDDGYEVLWRQKADAPFKAVLKSFVPLWDLIEAIQEGKSPAIGIAIVGNVAMLLSTARPAVAIGRAVGGISRAAVATSFIRQTVSRMRAGSNIASAVAGAASDPVVTRAVRVAGHYGRVLASEAGQVTLSVIDPGVEGLARIGVGVGRAVAPVLGRAVERMGASLSRAYAAALVRIVEPRIPASLATLWTDAGRFTIIRDSRRPNGLYHFYELDAVHRAPYGRRLAIGADGKIFEAPKPPDRIELARAPHGKRYEGAIPRDVRVDWTPLLESKPSGKAVVRIDQTYYEASEDQTGIHLSRVADQDVRKRDANSDAADQYTVYVRGTRHEPVLSLEKDAPVSVGAGLSRAEVRFWHALKRYEVEPTLEMLASQADASGVLMSEGRRYLRIDGKYYFIIRDRDGVRICLETARSKPCFPVDYDATHRRWGHAAPRGARGGADDPSPDDVDRWMADIGREFADLDASMMQRIRDMIAQRLDSIDLSGLAVTTVPQFVRRAHWLRSLTLRPTASAAFVVHAEALGAVRELHLRRALSTGIVIHGPAAGLESEHWLDSLSVSGCLRLRQLNVDSCRLGSVTIDRAPLLKGIVIRNAQLERIQVTDSLLLEELDLRYNVLEDFRIELQGAQYADAFGWSAEPTLHGAPYSRLEQVHLGVNRLVRVPASLSALPGLTMLDVSSNRLASLEGFGEYPNLRELGVYSNELTSLEGLQNSHSLEGIAATDNQIVSLDAIRALPSLRQLNVAGNKLASFPWDLTSAGSMQALFLNRNRIETVPAAIRAWQSLHTLVLSDNRIWDVASEIGLCRELESLYLRRNVLAQLPASMRALPLERLAISGNQFTELPDWIGVHPSLVRLDADSNAIRSLPAAMTAPMLRDIDLSNNPLGNVPAAWSEANALPSLKHLWLASTRIVDVSGLSALRNVVVLDLSGNPIESLPQSFSNLAELQWLNLEECRFSTLPNVLEAFPSTTIVRIVYGNPFTDDMRASFVAALAGDRRGASIPLDARPEAPTIDFSFDL